MYLDVFTISALVDEFMDTFVGGRVQDSIDVDETGLGLEIYVNHKRHYLYMSADHLTPRIHLVADKLRRGLTKPTQLGLLFRSYVEGGVVLHVSQPEWERVLHLHIDGPKGEVEVIVEPMERRSNILLAQNGVILDSMRRVGPEDNRYRLSLPKHAYVPPPPQTSKRDPFGITTEDMIGFFQQSTDPKQKAFQILTGHLLGMSPLLAREIVYRATGDAKAKAQDADPSSLFDVLQTVLTPLRQRDWKPGIVEDTDGLIEAYSVYPVTYLNGWRRVDSISEAMASYYGAPVGEDAYNAGKKPVQTALNEAKAKMQAKLESLERSMTDDTEREVLRQSGELILAYQYSLEPGQRELRAQYDADKPELVIALNPDLPPMENAQRYFTRYNKAKRALDDVPGLISQTKTELQYLEQLESDLTLATNWSEIDDVRQALQSSGYWKGKKTKRIGGGGQSAPIRHVTKDGFVLWIGRNSRQNEIVTFKKASGQDFWLHARDVPGAHVIIKFDGRRISETLIEQAAAIAAYYSSRRNEGRVPVDVTRIKYVKKIKGGGQGMVTYRNETTVIVTPQDDKSFEQA
jgi:predicted ribosome quality control (RQC) complex YloA/Tae2 family protein